MTENIQVKRGREKSINELQPVNLHRDRQYSGLQNLHREVNSSVDIGEACDDCVHRSHVVVSSVIVNCTYTKYDISLQQKHRIRLPG